MATVYGRIVLDGIEPVLYPAGIPIVGATLNVYLTGTTNPATIYANPNGSGSPLANPQTSDSAGRFYAQSTTLWADQSQGYDLVVAYPAGGSTPYSNVFALGPAVNTSGFLQNPNVALTGVPTAPTPAANNVSSDIATTQFVANALALAVTAPLPYAVDTGAPNAYVVMLSAGITAYEPGLAFNMEVGSGNTNTTASTVNVNGLGAKNITYQGVDVTAGFLTEGQIALMVYDGTEFQLNNATEGSLVTANYAVPGHHFVRCVPFNRGRRI